MVRNTTGETQLFLGTETGPIMQFSGIDGNVQGTFELLSSDFEHIREGARTALTSADLNNDGLIDLIIGNTGGGLAVWMHQTVEVAEIRMADAIQLFPNPASRVVNIILPEEANLPMQLSLFDQQGRLLTQQSLVSSRSELSVHDLSPGCYTLQMVSDRFVVNKRLVVQR
jgi:hypothetical protein